jgi:hypothetical protein
LDHGRLPAHDSVSVESARFAVEGDHGGYLAASVQGIEAPVFMPYHNYMLYYPSVYTHF